jgi:sugar/nucleoside kinase (ribokinase family)
MRLPFAVPESVGHAYDVVGLGQNSVDYMAVAPRHPSPDSKLALDTFAIAPGGQVATAVAACARLGWRARYIGSFGDDAPGRLAKEHLEREGVDVSAARVVPGASNRLAVILVNSGTGERTILAYRDPALALPDVPGEAVTAGRFLLVDGDDLQSAVAAAMAARKAGTRTIVDVDACQPELSALLRHIDALITAEEFPAAWTGYPELGRALEALEREFQTPVVCATLGREGSLARSGGREIRTAPFPVTCVDSTGAGDVFRGAFAAGCLRWPGGELEQVLRHANAAAALACRALGAMGALPSTAEVDALLGV